jgi:hypothetical protein
MALLRPDRKNKSNTKPTALPVSAPNIIEIKNADTLQGWTGKSSCNFIVKEMKDGKLILDLTQGQLFSVIIPPHWEDIELVETNISIGVTAKDKGILLSISDPFAYYHQLENGRNDKILVTWRGRNFLLIQNLPEQYYTVYSVLTDKQYLVYDNHGNYYLKEKPSPYRVIGYGPLLDKEEKRKNIRAMPCMLKRGF